MLRPVIAVSLFALGLSGVALVLHAQPPGPPPGGKAKGDKGGPGKGDKGGPGGGTPVSVEAMVARLMAYDANKDGKLTKEELGDERLHPLFDRADADKDGFVTREELTALLTKEVSATTQGGGSGGGSGPGGPPPKR